MLPVTQKTFHQTGGVEKKSERDLFVGGVRASAYAISSLNRGPEEISPISVIMINYLRSAAWPVRLGSFYTLGSVHSSRFPVD